MLTTDLRRCIVFLKAYQTKDDIQGDFMTGKFINKICIAGFDVLTAMERIPVDADDRPEQEIKITGTEVFVNPYKELEDEEKKKADAGRRKVQLNTVVCLY